MGRHIVSLSIINPGHCQVLLTIFIIYFSFSLDLTIFLLINGISITGQPRTTADSNRDSGSIYYEASASRGWELTSITFFVYFNVILVEKR